jgi:hypothetical protein
MSKWQIALTQKKLQMPRLAIFGNGTLYANYL